MNYTAIVNRVGPSQTLLGVAYGHRSKVAGGNIVAPGRVVPNSCQIPPPKTILMKFS